MSIARKIVVFGVLVLALGAIPAKAQTNIPAVEFSAGYNYLYLVGDDGDEGLSFPVGWYGEVAGNVMPNLAIVGHVTGNYRSEEELGFEANADFHTFTGGIRFIGRTRQANPFVQVLFGGIRGSVSSNIQGFEQDETTGVMLLGGGVDVLPEAPVGFRIGADYIRVLSDGGGNAFRFNIGIVFGN